MRARSHGEVAALSLSQCLISPGGQGGDSCPHAGHCSQGIPKAQIPKTLVLQCTKGCSCQLQGWGWGETQEELL